MRPSHEMPPTRSRGGPTVIALHSSGASGRQWQPLADRLAGRTAVIAPDLTGHGAGPGWNDGQGSILSADVARVARLAAGAPGGVHLVGHSYGGAIAMHVALTFPERVRSLTVFEPVLFRLLGDLHGRLGPSASVLDVAAAMRRDLRSALLERAAQRFVDSWSGAGTWNAMPRERRIAVALRMPAVSAQFPALWNDPAGLADYRSIAVPILILSGQHSRPAPRRICELLRAAFPSAQYQSMSTMGHLGPITHPNTVAQRIDTFLAGVGATQTDLRLEAA